MQRLHQSGNCGDKTALVWRFREKRSLPEREEVLINTASLKLKDIDGVIDFAYENKVDKKVTNK